MVNKCLLKVAYLAAQLEKYELAIEKFEEVATASVDNQLTKWSLKEYFLKAGLCHLCTGVSLCHATRLSFLFFCMSLNYVNRIMFGQSAHSRDTATWTSPSKTRVNTNSYRYDARFAGFRVHSCILCTQWT